MAADLVGSMQSKFFTLREHLSPILTQSKFKQHGRLTPAEFILAGDYLVFKFPSWSWQSGDESKRKDYLEPDKQFLVQKGVPSFKRANELGFEGEERIVEPDVFDGEDVAGWVETHPNSAGAASHAEIPDIDETSAAAEKDVSPLPKGEEHIPDIDDEEDYGVLNVEDVAAALPKTDENGKTFQTRTYDCYITYDKFYQVPRLWLSGFNENGTPLPPTEILSDISSDHANKTVTVEPFPNLSKVVMASVHPCKHAGVMTRVIERMNNALIEQQRVAKGEVNQSTVESSRKAEKKKSGWLSRFSTSTSSSSKLGDGEEVEGLRVDQYLLVFLKFISTIAPTIEIDATSGV